MRRISLIIVLLLGLGISTHGQAWSTFLDASRATTWQGNVGFAIPNYSVPCATQPSLLTGSGNASANATAIQNALNSCDATHNVVNLPSGTYFVAGFNFGSQGKQVLRGTGSSAPANICAASSTCLIITSNSGCTGLATGICINGSTFYAGSAAVLPPSGNHQCSWTAGYAQGATSITLNSCGGTPTSNGLAVGKLLILDQSNDLTDNGGYFLCDSATSSQVSGSPCTLNDGAPTNFDGRRIGGFTYSQKQIVVVQSISGSGTGPYTVTISPGVYFNNIRSGQTPGAWWAGNFQNEGLENLYIDGTALSVFNIEIAGCYQCWVKGVASYNAARAHVDTNLSANTVIRDSYFFQSQSHASQSYGWEPEQTSAELVENNIFQQVTSPLISGNTSGSVVGYNLMIGGVYVTPNYLQSSYASHNAGNNFYLIEGNNALNIATDDTWGSSHAQTYFRNFLAGWQHQPSGPVWNTSPFIDRSYSRINNLVGNVLGQPGYHSNYESYATSTTAGVNQNLLSLSIYSLGWTGLSETTAGTCGSPLCDALVRSTLMRWGNYDTVNAATQWNSTEASPAAVSFVNANFTTTYFNSLAHTLPASLYYSSMPSWWPSGKAWPPIGPDVVTGNLGTCTGTYSGAQAILTGQCIGGVLNTAWAAHATSLPAQDCFLVVMHGPPDGSGSMLAFNANTCYAAIPIATFTPASVNFGQVPAGLTSNPISVTLQNTGSANLVVSTVSLGSAVFSLINNTCGSPATITNTIPGTGFTLTPGASCTFQAIYQPAVPNFTNTASVFFSPGASNPDTLGLTGQSISTTAPGTVFAGNAIILKGSVQIP